MYYSTGTLTQFWSNFKNYKKSNFDWNEVKLSTQHKYKTNVQCTHNSDNAVNSTCTALTVF